MMKILQEHLNNIANTLSAQHQATSISKHGGNTGTAREYIIKNFLNLNLPSSVSYSGGELFDSNDDRSGQIDIAIFQNDLPKLHIEENINLLPVDSALAVIECKSSLTTGDMETSNNQLKIALDSCKKVKSLQRLNTVGIGKSYFKEKGISEVVNSGDLFDGNLTAHIKTPYMIFTFEGPDKSLLQKKLFEYQTKNDISLDDMPEVITVLDKGYYLVKNNGWLIQQVPGNVHWSSPQQDRSTLIGMYMYLMKIIEANGMSKDLFPLIDYLR
ncbi:DUF6602 domain-containing protein [Salinivibrio kushneri]|uniref:DUF6602 domain-containing protein n=2 Tax=Salinivibrio kushneri TaxID=1908198 RepID=UPI000984542A|nr:DUF6602 domain-containing protein [Salinivibrio kushneri]OOE47366.1 hypothetical protein BZG11_15570 [Salinivibrio kushneri]OOE57822.1 hypothetical protein BZG18_15585 [Salinivibrio kushneri]